MKLLTSLITTVVMATSLPAIAEQPKVSMQELQSAMMCNGLFTLAEMGYESTWQGAIIDKMSEQFTNRGIEKASSVAHRELRNVLASGKASETIKVCSATLEQVKTKYM